MSKVGNAAMAALNAGISVVPILNDGSKRPPFKWSAYQSEPATEDQIKSWFANGGYTGFALICGAGSGNLEVLDFDDAGVYDEFVRTANALGLGELVDRIITGYAERTPSGGMHLPYYCDEIGGNTKLARRIDKEVLIETRGTGGYIVAAPSNGTVHENGGAWSIVSGGVYSIATITPGERADLLQLARSFDQVPPMEVEERTSRPAVSSNGTMRPGDDFRDRHRTTETFREIVEPHGWKLTHRRGNVGYFRRPGKDSSWSATFNHADSGLFYVFSNSTGFEAERGYNPFSVYAILNHRGDFGEAASALTRRGFGARSATSLGSVTVGGPRSSRAKQEQTAFAPTQVPNAAVVGWFRDYLDLVEPTTESPDAFHLAASVSLIGACIGKRVGLFHSSDKLYPNFYTLLIGPSGRSRKDTAIRRMLELFYARPPRNEPLIATAVPFQVVRDISSSEGLIARLRKTPNVVLYTSEFAKVMSNAAREATRSIGPTLIEAFDTPPSLQNNTKANVEASEPMEAKDPFVTVLATVQPEILAELIGSQQQYSGFLNRWLLVVGDGKGARPNPPNLDEDGAWRLLREITKAINSYDDKRLLEFSAGAADLWSDWYIESYPSGHETAQEDAMGIRRGTLIKKIALVHAISQGATAVNVDHLEAGIAFGDWAWEHTKRLMPMWGESADAQIERKILECLNRHGPQSKRFIRQRIGSRLGPGVFARVVKSMAENGQIAIDERSVVAVIGDDSP